MRNPFNVKLTLKNLALFNFFILCFFSFFGTNLPWQVRSEDYFEVDSTNIVNQILYLYLFLFSIPPVLSKTKNFIEFIKKEKYLTLFITVCLISFIWSDHSFESIKRSFQLFVMFFSILITFLFSDQKNIIKIVRVIVTLYILTTLLTIIFFKEAIDPQFNTWRGIHNNKNGLSQMGVFSFLLSLVFFESWNNLYNNIWNISISFLSILFIFMAGSSNSIISIFIIFCTMFIIKVEKLIQILQVGRTFIFVIFLFIILLFITIFIYSEQLLTIIPAIFNKDLTLTGRTLFWKNLLIQIGEKPWGGYGYGTFWVMGTVRLNQLFFEVNWEFNSAHNGFIDIALQLGITGMVFLIFLLSSFFKRILAQHDNISLLFIIYVFVGNLTESILFLPRLASTLVFIFFYIRLSQNYFFNYTSS